MSFKNKIASVSYIKKVKPMIQNQVIFMHIFNTQEAPTNIQQSEASNWIYSLYIYYNLEKNPREIKILI